MENNGSFLHYLYIIGYMGNIARMTLIFPTCVMPHLCHTTQAVTLTYNARLTLHLITTGMKGNPTMRKYNCVNKEGCLCPPQKGKRDYMNTKQYKQLAQIAHLERIYLLFKGISIYMSVLNDRIPQFTFFLLSVKKPNYA
jgi:hypothetical protein